MGERTRRQASAVSAFIILVCGIAHSSRAEESLQTEVAGPEDLVAAPTNDPDRPVTLPAKPVRQPTAAALTLDDALDLARTLNPVLLAKRKELGIADGELRQASIYFQKNPELSLRVANRRFPSSNERETTTAINLREAPASLFSLDSGLTSTESKNATDIGIELSQEFEVFGQPRARRRAFMSARESVAADIAAVEWEVLAQVRGDFYSAQIAQLRLELAENQYEFASKVLELSERRFDAGDISRLEYRQVAIQTAGLETNLIAAKAELESFFEALRLSLGLPPSATLHLPASMPATTRIVPPQQQVVDAILRIHPVLRLVRLVVEQRQRELTLTKKEVRPNITAALFFGREGDKESSSTRSFGVSDGFSFRRSSRSTHEEIFGLGISVPLWLFNRGQGTIAATRAALEVAQAVESATMRELSSRANTALQRLFPSYESAALYGDEILPNILSNLELLDNAFRQGELSLLELRVSQRDLLEAQSAGLDSLSEYFLWRAEVEGLLGRSLPPDGNPLSERPEEGNDAL